LTLIDLFEKQVKETPHLVSICFNSNDYTYIEINRDANQLGAYLRDTYFIEPDDLVGIHLEKSEKMLISILAVLKAGGAYVPIEISYPQERIDYIKKDINAKVIIDNNELEKFYHQKNKYSKDNLLKINSSNDLAYVIFTSGTTGNPKGVLVEHRNLVARINYYREFYNLTETMVSLFYRSFSFDGAIEEYLMPLFFGGKIVIANSDFYTDLNEKIIETISENKITKVNMPPVLLNNILSDDIYRDRFSRLTTLRQVVSGGDVLNIQYIRKIEMDANFYNSYGPTENTIDSTNWKVDRSYKSKESIIGKPVLNSMVYILDENLQLSPIGVQGKIFVSGAGIARGYLNNPVLTNEKFIINPFVQNLKMYETGDIGRWLLDGNIEYIGRSDDQVKIRGHRIELAEIEASFLSYSKMIKQVCIVVKNLNHEKSLILYYTSNSKIERTDLRNYLLKKLPEYMIPAFYIEVDSMPLTANGKIDKNSLPSISQEDFILKEYVPPTNETEKKLIKIWEEVLGVKKIGITDNFFELGGDSLKVTRVIIKIKKEFNAKILLKNFFRDPTIYILAEEIENLIWLKEDKTANNEGTKITI